MELQPHGFQCQEFRTGQTVYIHGLKNARELNGTLALVVGADKDRWLLRTKNANIVKIKPCNIKSTEEEGPSCIEDMDWGQHASEGAFLAHWAWEMHAKDADVFEQCDRDVFSYLTTKVLQVVHNKQKVKEAGWVLLGATPSEFLCCAVWADGTHEQSSPMTERRPYEKWWPCIVIEQPNTEGLMPFYCPVLAMNGSRPWFVHPSRIRRVRRSMSLLQVPVRVCTEASLKRQDISEAMTTSTVEIEEVFDWQLLDLPTYCDGTQPEA